MKFVIWTDDFRWELLEDKLIKVILIVMSAKMKRRERNMNNPMEISMKSISPNIRYINDIIFEEFHVVEERVLFDHEFILGLEGEAKMIYGEETYTIHAGDMFLIKPNIKNIMYVEKGKYFHAHCVHFDWVTLDEQFNFAVEKTYFNLKNIQQEKLLERPNYQVSEFYFPTLIHEVGLDKLRPLFKEMYYYFHQSDLISHLQVKSIFLNIVSICIAQRLTQNGLQKDHYHTKTINQAVEYIHMNYTKSLNTKDMALKYDLSPKYFGTLFKEITGIAMNEYTLNVRLVEAKRLLLSSDDSLENLASQLGFSDVYYFTKLFKRYEGITPGKYRKMLRFVKE